MLFVYLYGNKNYFLNEYRIKRGELILQESTAELDFLDLKIIQITPTQSKLLYFQESSTAENLCFDIQLKKKKENVHYVYPAFLIYLAFPLLKLEVLAMLYYPRKVITRI